MCCTPKRPARPRQGIKMIVEDRNASYSSWQHTLLKGQELAQRRQLLEKDFDIGQELKINNIICPSHILNLKNALQQIEPKQTLKITVPSKVIHDELLSAAQQMGHQIESCDSNQFLYVTK